MKRCGFTRNTGKVNKTKRWLRSFFCVAYFLLLLLLSLATEKLATLLKCLEKHVVQQRFKIMNSNNSKQKESFSRPLKFNCTDLFQFS